MLDALLALEQPIHGGVPIVLVGIEHAKVLGQGARVPLLRDGLDVRRDDARGHHGQFQAQHGDTDGLQEFNM
ncbi:hypothetical protein [Verminephrobacter aporrectodeae]|uniref:hypothetical protein n=1 Tax=Verminephrobacter aporrectodeae TaxID=1110389 RepID=UPI0022447E75|nr:hypothetical protein [Verminephrobacter aporrectodeae]